MLFLIYMKAGYKKKLNENMIFNPTKNQMRSTFKAKSTELGAKLRAKLEKVRKLQNGHFQKRRSGNKI